jgi:hypothetical protein
LFCHHFQNKELVAQFNWMKNNVSLGFFINDLQRHWLAYSSIQLLTKLFSRSYLVKNDAPLSVLRGFNRYELEAMTQQAMLENFELQWKWAFRWLLIYRHG